MDPYSPSTLVSNILINAKLLQSDFIGIVFNFPGILLIILNIFFVFLLIVIFYLIGKKIRLLFFKKEELLKLNCFVDIALGYIFIGTGIALLGVFSILYNLIIYIFLSLAAFTALYPFIDLKYRLRELFYVVENFFASFKKNKWILLAVLGFVIVAFLRLIPPEIGEDAIGYHTSLPYLYLKNHSILIDPKYSFGLVFPVPQLGEMLYVFTQSLGLKDTSRYTHFGFYVLVILLLCCVFNKKRRHTGLNAALLFVTAPIVIQVSSKANGDFQWLFLWLLSILILTKKKINKEEIRLSAILFGGVLATKIWTIAYIPIFLLFFIITNRDTRRFGNASINFLIFSFLVPFLWYVRSYLLTGNPFFPGLSQNSISSLFDILGKDIGFASQLFNFSTLIVFSPLFYMGILFIFFFRLSSIKNLFRSRLFLLTVLLLTGHLFLPRHIFPRYLMGVYLVTVIIVSIVINRLTGEKKLLGLVFFSGYIIVLLYYVSNTVLTLPYGFGWADKNRYLTRILSKDNSSYYDFDKLFNKWISEKDLVATYGIGGYYYANFSYIDSSVVFNNKNKSFDLLKSKKVSHLLIQGGDLYWYCRKLELRGCMERKVKLVASYPPGFKKYNLYIIK